MIRSARIISDWRRTATNPNFLWPEDITNKHRQSKIIAVVPNPKVVGMKPWKRFNCYKVGMIGQDYIDTVVSKRVGNEREAVADLAFDNNHYYIRWEEPLSGDIPSVQRNDDEREQISMPEIESRTAANAWIGIDAEIAMASQSKINRGTQNLINNDLVFAAFEGLTEERMAMLRKRAAWIADRFIRYRMQSGRLICDKCGFDPVTKIANTKVTARSLLDVHHMKSP